MTDMVERLLVVIIVLHICVTISARWEKPIEDSVELMGIYNLGLHLFSKVHHPQVKKETLWIHLCRQK